MNQLDRAKASVVTVGDGRGFVVNGLRNYRLIVIAAHCLPFLPPCDSASDLEERTYKALLSPIGKEPVVWAECLFANPIADVAVLGSPDNQELSDQAEAYEALAESATAIPITDALEKGQGWLLSLDQKWVGCSVQYMKHVDGSLWVSNLAQPIVGGMSGSPIVSEDGAAIGIVSLSSNVGEVSNPRLVRDVPVWLLRAQNSSRALARCRLVTPDLAGGPDFHSSAKPGK